MPAAASAPLAPVSPDRVLVFFSARDPHSRALAGYYAGKRRIPPGNVVGIVCPPGDDWRRAEYEATLEAATRRRAGADKRIEYVVLARGIPFRLADSGEAGGYSVDSVLATCLLAVRPGQKARSPFYERDARHARAASATGGLLLVTRLDGPTPADARAWVDSGLRARPARGPFFLRDSFVAAWDKAEAVLQARGLVVERIAPFNNPRYPRYEGSGGPFMAHWGAGPHDTQYSPEEYARLRFLPGALAELTWSFSAGELRDEKSKGNIALVARGGAAGAQGFVSEPYADAISRPEIVLERYVRGYNLAEAFYMGTPYLPWKQVVLGDPLCAPYAAGA